jgi:hypothetical protein
MVATLLVGVAGEALARPDSLQMTCAQTRALVARSGGIVIGTGPNIYARFVSDARFCYPTQYLKPTWIATKDTKQCPVGYRCVDDPPPWY